MALCRCVRDFVRCLVGWFGGFPVCVLRDVCVCVLQAR